MEIFSVILMLLLIPLLCLLAPVFLVGLLGVMIAFALKRGQRIYVEVPRQPAGKRKNDDPFFQPGVMLDNMPNFQQGIMSALARFGFELTDQLGRTRGSSEADPDLQRAAGLLQYPGNVWIWNPSVSLAPRASSESQYRDAREKLLTYNRRLAAGNALPNRCNGHWCSLSL